MRYNGATIQKPRRCNEHPGARPNRRLIPLSELSLTRFKRCPKCGCTKPSTVDFFNRKKSNICGLQSWCKVCSRANNRRWVKDNAQRHYERGKAYYEANKEQVDAYRRQWAEENHERISDLARGRYERERDRILANSKRWKMENAERIKTQQYEYRQINKDRIQEVSYAWRAKNKEKCREYERRWRENRSQEQREIERHRAREYAKKNRHEIATRSRKYRALRREADGEHTAQEVWEILENQDHLCAWCEAPLMGDFEVDHFWPLVKGGPDYAANLCASCMSCNRRKHAKTPLEFVKRLGYDVVEEG